MFPEQANAFVSDAHSRTVDDTGRPRLPSFPDTASSASTLLQPESFIIDWEQSQRQYLAERLRPSPSDGLDSLRPHAPPSPRLAYRDPDQPPTPIHVRSQIRLPFAEWLGTVVFMTIGLSGSVVHMTSQQSNADLLNAYLAWGFGVMMGIYVVGGVSGAHLNPAISIMLSLFRGFPWSLCWQYVVAQLLGTISASGIVFGLYQDAIKEYAAADFARAGPAFYTKPRDGLSVSAAFFTEFVATAIASGSVLALGDARNSPPSAGMHAFIIGLLITALCMAFSYNTGTCLNPARDFGPRLIVWAAGSGTEVFTMHDWWWIWGPWGATISGALAGASVYDALIFEGDESPVNHPWHLMRRRMCRLKEPGRGPRRTHSFDTSRDVEKQVDTFARWYAN